MNLSAGLFAAIALLAVAWASDLHAAPRTVCTITVNSSDEKDMFRQRLPGTSIGSWSLWSAAAPIGSRRRAARVCAAICS